MRRRTTGETREALSTAVPREVRPFDRRRGKTIAGIRVTIEGRELAVRIAERMRWHRERADILIQQMQKLLEVERSAADDLVQMLGRCESPRALLEMRVRRHEQRAAFLAFLRDHLALDATYRLDASDLKMIDVYQTETPESA